MLTPWWELISASTTADAAVHQNDLVTAQRTLSPSFFRIDTISSTSREWIYAT